jgi:hypothetical protein
VGVVAVGGEQGAGVEIVAGVDGSEQTFHDVDTGGRDVILQPWRVVSTHTVMV